MTYDIGKDEKVWERIYGTDERLHPELWKKYFGGKVK